jgi:sodium-dependent dicarboxylate transporter 2/3/5
LADSLPNATRLAISLGIAVAAAVGVWIAPLSVGEAGLSVEAHRLASVLAAVVVLWVSETLPLPVTALAGVSACVITGVGPARDVFRPFAQPLIFLFIGSFMLAEAIRVHGLDKRLAYAVLAQPWVGEQPKRIMAAVAIVCGITSGVISNTATTAMMFAIVSGILAAIEQAHQGESGRQLNPRFATGLLLVVAFASSIGGLATPIGTPPNLIGLAFIEKQLAIDISFFSWCLLGVPLTVAMLGVVVVVAASLFPAGVSRLEGVTAYVHTQRQTLGRWTTGQRSAAVAFALTVSLWVAPGVLALLVGKDHPLCQTLSSHVPEGVAALLGAIALFILPGGNGTRVLSWEQAAKIDWGVILLYGGGMALGELSFTTGLADGLGRSITGLIPEGGGITLIAAAALVAAITSEFTSNTASANMVVPVGLALATAVGADPLPAALAATFAASLGFMMPVSTPCNAIVYGSGRVPLRDMVRAGAVLDVAGATCVTIGMLSVGRIWTP